MGLVFTGNPPRFNGGITAEVPTPNYSGISSDDANTSINPYTGQGPGAGGAGQTTAEVESSRSGGVSDEFFSSVVLLLHLDDNKTDSSNIGTSYIDGGTPVFSTTNKFGTHSLSASSSSYLTAAHNINVSVEDGDFTLELFFSTNDSPGANRRLITMGINNGIGGLHLLILTDGKIRCDGDSGSVIFTSSGALNDENFHHLAVVRSGEDMTMWVDGVSSATATNSDNFNQALAVGIAHDSSLATSFNFLGLLDEIRITKGVARYTSPFTPATEAFPDQ